jgi:hypothetical protein
MLLLSASIHLLVSSAILVNANVLRNNEPKAELQEHRKLNWEMLVPGFTDIATDVWYTDYDSSEIPPDLSSPEEDRADKFRDGDVCYNGGTYDRSSCPAELDCSHLNDPTLGSAKLCINRVPTSAGLWYVLLQKCIPSWDNCDKCICGQMTSDYSSGVCVYMAECSSDDSRIEIDCTNPSDVKVLGDYSFSSGTGTGYSGPQSTMALDIGAVQKNSAAVTDDVGTDDVGEKNSAAVTDDGGEKNSAAPGGDKGPKGDRRRRKY